MQKMCKKCNTEKNISEFQKDRSKSEGVSSRCKECAHEYDRKRHQNSKESRNNQRKIIYGENRHKIIARIKDYRQNRGGNEVIRIRTKKLMSEFYALLGNKCTACSRTNNLSMDHIKNNGKSERNTSKWAIIRKALKDTEKQKEYQLLCNNCNQKKQIARARNESISKPLNGELKLCNTCSNNRDISLFHTHPSYGDGLYYECSICINQRRDEIKMRAFSLLGCRCRSCEESDIDVLSMDHIDPIGGDRKVYGAALYRKLINKSYDISKFQILCFNCNQKKHGGERRQESYYLSKLEPTDIIIKSQPTVDFDFKTVSIKEIESDVAIPFLSKYHYDQYGRSAKKNYGFYLNDELIAVVKFCSQTRQGTAKSLGLSGEQVLELDRFCIHPARHKKNFGSWMMKRTIKHVRKDFPRVVKLVSFTDPMYGHDGTLYRSSNWAENGKTAASYYYLNQDNKMIKKRTLYGWITERKLNENKTEFQIAYEMGLKRITTPPKTRFTYDIKSVY